MCESMYKLTEIKDCRIAISKKKQRYLFEDTQIPLHLFMRYP